MCARGATGEAPFCKSCGECFENWDKTIQNFEEQMNQLEKNAMNIYANLGNNSANLTEFYNQYDEIVFKLNNVSIVVNQIDNLTDKDLINMNNNLRVLRLFTKNLLKWYKYIF